MDKEIVSEAKELRAYMLGTMALELDHKLLPLAGNPSSKLLQLFFILLYYGEDGVYREELLDMLYENGENANPAGSLRAVTFRLRKALEQWGLPPHEYICIQGGIYYFDPGSLNIWIDAREFKEMAETAIKTGREEDLKAACGLYQGEFLSQLSGEKWVSMIGVYLQDLYFRCLRQVYGQMRANREYDELLELCSAACSLYPYEDCQIMKIDCLIAMKRYKEAMEVYEQAVARYFEEQGLPPSEKMLQRFQIMSSQIRYTEDTLRDVKESLYEREKANGPYYCSYPGFIDCCRLLARMAERMEFCSVLLCCTLLDAKGRPLDEGSPLLKEASACLRTVISGTLRKGDLFTCYHPSQYLLLLNGTGQKNSVRVYERIQKDLEARFESSVRKIRLNYQLIPWNGIL